MARAARALCDEGLCDASSSWEAEHARCGLWLEADLLPRTLDARHLSAAAMQCKLQRLSSHAVSFLPEPTTPGNDATDAAIECAQHADGIMSQAKCTA